MQPITATIYTSPTCGYCHMAEEYFKDKGIEYSKKDITVDQNALKFVVEEVGQAVTPIITINETVIIGFDRPKLDEAVEKARQNYKAA